MKVAVFCNSVLGFNTIQFLYSQKLLVGLVIPAVQNDATTDLQTLAKNYNIPYKVVAKEDVEKKLAAWLGLIGADVAWVLTFPFKISKQVLNTLPLGVFNFHFGQLPAYRGADPIFWQIKNRETLGGISIHKMDEGLDTGPIVLQAPIPIRKGDTYGIHTRILGDSCVQVAYEFVQRLRMMGNKIPLMPQDISKKKYYGRPVLKDVSIDWDIMTADEIVALVDACNPWNKGAYTMWKQTPFKIIQASTRVYSGDKNGSLKPGTIINCIGKEVEVITVDNAIITLEVISIDEGIFTADFLGKIGVKENQILGKAM